MFAARQQEWAPKIKLYRNYVCEEHEAVKEDNYIA